MKRVTRLLVGLLLVPACAAQPPSGSVRVDGSSTVKPILETAVEMFSEKNPRQRITVGSSGTGGGFKKFLESNPQLRTDIQNASRPISPTELERAKAIGVSFIELPIAYDGLVVVAHPGNKFADSLTLGELKRIWSPSSTIQNWKDVRPGFPDLPMKLYGAGPDSGTFDYFTEVVVGQTKSIRSDYMASEDDNVLVHGVSGDPGSLGFFGYAYYQANRSRLKLIAIDSGDGRPVLPTPQTIADGTYSPLSRPLLIYVNRESAEKPGVAGLVRFLLENPKAAVEHPAVGYVALPEPVYQLARRRFEQRIVGTVFTSPESQRQPLTSLFALPE